MLAEILQKYIFIFNIFYLKIFFIFIVTGKLPFGRSHLNKFPAGSELGLRLGLG